MVVKSPKSSVNMFTNGVVSHLGRPATRWAYDVSVDAADEVRRVLAEVACEDRSVRSASIRIGLLAAILVIGGAACGDDDDTTATTTTSTTTTVPGPVSSASDASCAARDELQAAISDLANVDVVRNGTSSITAALTRIKNALGQVRATAGADVQPQVTAFQQSLDQLQAAITGGTSQAAAIASAARDVASTGSTLITSLGNLRCP